MLARVDDAGFTEGVGGGFKSFSKATRALDTVVSRKLNIWNETHYVESPVLPQHSAIAIADIVTTSTASGVS